MSLGCDAETFTTKILVKFSPKVISPSQLKPQAEVKETTFIHEGGHPSDECGAWKVEWLRSDGPLDAWLNLWRIFDEVGPRFS